MSILGDELNIFGEKLEWDWDEFYRDLNVYFDKKKREWPPQFGRIREKAEQLGIDPNSDEMINWILRQALMGKEEQLERIDEWYYGDHVRPSRPGGESAADRSYFWKYGPRSEINFPGYCATCGEESSGPFSARKGPALLVIIGGQIKAIHAGCFTDEEE